MDSVHGETSYASTGFSPPNFNFVTGPADGDRGYCSGCNGSFRMTFTGTSLDEKTVELINLVISDINACKTCTSAHVDKGRQLGLSDDALLEAIQCAAVVQSGVQFLKAAGY